MIHGDDFGGQEKIYKNQTSEDYMYVMLVEVIVGEGGFGSDEMITK